MGAKFNNGKSRQDYGTPNEFLNAACKRLGIPCFTWDLAASDENRKACYWYTQEDDSLAQDWDLCGGWLWLNPPYSNITPWVAKAASCVESNIAMLIPASVGANWWKEHVHNRAHVLLLNGRITFEGASDPYPKDCALLLYTPAIKGGYEVWSWQK